MNAKPLEPEIEFPLPAANSAVIETPELIEKIKILARTHCTLIEAAAFLDLLPDEFELFLLENRKSFIAWFSGEAAGRAALKMQQFKNAQKGDSRMLVWLGENILGQSHKLPTKPPQEPAPVDQAWDSLATWRMQRLG